jgi:hypothetical protein
MTGDRSFSFLQALSKWYEGEFVPRPNDANSAVVFVGGGTYKRSLSAQITRVVIEFYLANWKWCFGTLVAVAAALLTLLKH